MRSSGDRMHALNEGWPHRPPSRQREGAREP